MRTAEPNFIDTESWITLRWVRGTPLLPRALGTRPLARVAADKGQRPNRHAIGEGPHGAIPLD
jgi:hypothetical protein